jgi:uncharacterized membrane protein (DUF441 family)
MLMQRLGLRLGLRLVLTVAMIVPAAMPQISSTTMMRGQGWMYQIAVAVADVKVRG